MKLTLAIITSCFLLISCFNNKKNMKSKAKNTTEINKMLEAYKKQKHRLAFNECEMTYNEKSFKLGMTVKELIQIFGKYELTNLGAIILKDQGIVFGTDNKNINLSSVINIIYVYMNTTVSEDYKDELRHELNHKEDYFLVEGTPVNKHMRVMDFIENSEFKLSDFAVSNYAYELDYKCGNNKIGYRFKADGLWLRKGVGHLTYKDKPNPENKNRFESFYVTELKE